MADTVEVANRFATVTFAAELAFDGHSTPTSAAPWRSRGSLDPCPAGVPRVDPTWDLDTDRCPDCRVPLMPDELDEADGRGESTPPILIPSPLSQRAMAALLDYLLITAVTIAIQVTWTERVAADGVRWTTSSGSRVVPTTAAIIAIVAIRAAYDVVGVGRYGTTFGKSLYKLRVLDTDRERAGWVRAIVRYLVADAGWLVLLLTPSPAPSAVQWVPYIWLLVVYVPVLFDSAARGLHDRIAGTVVVRPKRPPGTLSIRMS